MKKIYLLLLLFLGGIPVMAQNKLAKGVAPVVYTPRQLLEQTHIFMQHSGGIIPKRNIYHLNQAVPVSQLNEAQLAEVRLARQVYHQLKNMPQPHNPDWLALQTIYTAQGKKRVPDEKVFLTQLQSWVEQHQGYRPRFNLYGENGKHLTAQQLKQHPQLYEEHTLARRIEYMLNLETTSPTVREELLRIRALPTVTRWQDNTRSNFYDGFGNPLPHQYTFLARLEQWVYEHGNRRPRSNFYYTNTREHKPVAELEPPQYEEYTLAQQLAYILQKGNTPPELRKKLCHINALPLYKPE